MRCLGSTCPREEKVVLVNLFYVFWAFTFLQMPRSKIFTIKSRETFFNSKLTK